MDIHRAFDINAAHRLTRVPADHPCGRLHGHTFRVEVHVQGRVGTDSGWVIDFAEIDRAFAPLHEALDHRYLNEISGLENPTSEMLAEWIWHRLHPSLPGLAAVVVQETADAGCIYRGEDGAR